MADLSRPALALLLSLTAAAAPAAKAKPVAPPAPDLPALLTCRQSYEDWMSLASAYTQPGATAAWGWRPKALGGGFLQGYTLKRPIKAFGQSVSTIAFSGSGVVAVLKEDALPGLVRDLNLQPVHDGPTAKLFGREVSSVTDQIGEAKAVIKISLSASSSPAYPGVALVGCSYAMEVN
jgi:hypothetical protein